jgi:hypothetical protein
MHMSRMKVVVLVNSYRPLSVVVNPNREDSPAIEAYRVQHIEICSIWNHKINGPTRMAERDAEIASSGVANVNARIHLRDRTC